MCCLSVGCNNKTAQQVVVYTALDEMYSRPILAEFERRTKIRVLPVYDTEAAKTTGLVTRLIAERGRPRADVFWNNEVAQTIALKQKGILEVYQSPSAASIPACYKDAQGYWTGFAARARVIVYNTNLVRVPPKSIEDFTRPEWLGKAAIALPLFGTTATHAGALFALWGDEKAMGFFRDLKENKVAMLPGNGPVCEMVARGEYAIGLTDTDDANGAILDGQPVRWIFPNQEPEGIGTLVIPNSVALVKASPNPEGAKALIDFLLSAEVESRLAKSRSMQIPLNPAVASREKMPEFVGLKAMKLSEEQIAAKMSAAAAFVQEEFCR